MTESIHLRRDLATRCHSHPLMPKVSLTSGSTITAHFCKNCGIAFTSAAGFYLRPSRFDSACNPPAPHSNLLRNMVLRQKINRPLSTEHIQPSLRLESIKWLQSLADRFGLQKTTFARAVALMDKFLSLGHLDPLDYNLVMILTLNLACKLSERESHTFTITQICQLLSGSYDADTVGLREVDIMRTLGWNLDVQTSHDFALYFIWRGVATSHDVNALTGTNDTDSTAIMDCLDQLVVKVLDLTLVDFRFYRYTPVGLAASAIAFARETMGMSPWSSDLRAVTDFNLDCLKGCLDVIRQLACIKAANSALRSILVRYEMDPHSRTSETADLMVQGERSPAGSPVSAAVPNAPCSQPSPISLLASPLRVIALVPSISTQPNVPRGTRRSSTKLPHFRGRYSLGRTGPRHARIRKLRN